VHSQHLCLEERWIFKLRNKEKWTKKLESHKLKKQKHFTIYNASSQV
jgi:hypothetical protein